MTRPCTGTWSTTGKKLVTARLASGRSVTVYEDGVFAC
jgi:hypothetical protein